MVDPNVERVKDGIYVFGIEETVLVKRLQRLAGGKVKVVSDHPGYEAYVDPKDPSLEFRLIGSGLVRTADLKS